MQKQLSIPVELNMAVQSLNFSKANNNHVYKLLDLLLRESSKSQNLSSYVPLPTAYLRKVFNSEYNENFLKPLKHAGIIECNESYRVGTDKSTGDCKLYRINAELVGGETETVSYIDKKPLFELDDYIPINQTYIHKSSYFRTPNSYGLDAIKELINTNKETPSSLPLHICYRFFRKQMVIDDLCSLRYNRDSLYKAIFDKIKSISRKDILVDNEIEQNWIRLIDNRLNGPDYEKLPKKSAISYAAQAGGSLIQRKREFYIDDVESFLCWKRETIEASARIVVENLCNGNFFVSRGKNDRLNHNLTNVSSDIVEAIKKDNDLVELDLKNSQFAIHAHWMKEEGLLSYSDAMDYYNASSEGHLYETIAEHIGKDRKSAKATMLYLWFSKSRSGGKNTKQIRQNYPTVFKHIDAFKAKYGYETFSVELQKREASMFIDNLYPNIKSEGLFCLTKHDSLLVQKKDVNEVVSIVQGYFGHIGFKGKLSDID